MCKPWEQMLSRTDSVQVHKPRGVQFQKRVNLKEACTHNMRDGSSSKIGPCFGKKMFQDDDHSGRERGDGDDESHVVNRRSQDSCPTELFVFGTGHVQVEQRSRGAEDPSERLDKGLSHLTRSPSSTSSFSSPSTSPQYPKRYNKSRPQVGNRT